MSDLVNELKSFPDSYLEDKLDNWQLMKRRRMQLIKGMLKEQGKIKVERFLAMMQVELGVHPRTARGYMQVLQDLGSVTIDKGYYIWHGSSTE